MQSPLHGTRSFYRTKGVLSGLSELAHAAVIKPLIFHHGAFQHGATEKKLKKVFLALPLLLLAGPALGQTDEQFRKSFQDMFAGSCVAEQRKAAPNLQISDAAIQNYCSCFGGQIPTAISVQEMRQVAATGTLTPELQSRLTALGKSCVDRLKQ
jgi:hypothetical protein